MRWQFRGAYLQSANGRGMHAVVGGAVVGWYLAVLIRKPATLEARLRVGKRANNDDAVRICGVRGCGVVWCGWESREDEEERARAGDGIQRLPYWLGGRGVQGCIYMRQV